MAIHDLGLLLDQFPGIPIPSYFSPGSKNHFLRTFLHRPTMLIKIQPDATVCRYLFTAKSLYMFRVSQHLSSSGVLKTVTAASGTGHNPGTATSLQRGLIRLCFGLSKTKESLIER